jgi:hypothetical protein
MDDFVGVVGETAAQIPVPATVTLLVAGPAGYWSNPPAEDLIASMVNDGGPMPPFCIAGETWESVGETRFINNSSA